MGKFKYNSLVNRVESNSSNFREFCTFLKTFRAKNFVEVINDRAVNGIFRLVSVGRKCSIQRNIFFRELSIVPYRVSVDSNLGSSESA